MIEPIEIKAGDERVLVNGLPLPVNYRIISEGNYKELKRVFDLNNVIARFSDEQIDDLIRELNEYARDYNHYEYGLPTHDKHMDNMRNIVKVKLNGL